MMRKFVPIAIAALCVVTLSAKKKADDYALFKKKLSKDEQAVHVLDRLTFGPRPGDVEAVNKLGVKKWIELQLHPDRIPENPELAARLEPLETLRLTTSQTASTYPTPQMIRLVASGRQKMPDDPLLRASIERRVRQIQIKQGDRDDAPFESKVPLDELLSPQQIQTLNKGKLEEKRAVLESIPENKIDDVVIALPPNLRNQLQPAASDSLRRKMLMANNPLQVVFFDLAEAKLYRAIYSNRQLEQELDDFWFNHFNVNFDKGADRFLIPTYERTAIRPHVLGHFRALLEATATSSAMLFYLDNWESVKAEPPGRGNRPRRGLNENYARELMELHTLGVDGGYTQKDVTEVARCFTGWTIRNPNQGGDFYFNDKVHDKGEKIVLGVKIPSGGGKEDGEKVLDILANHPSTARFISKKLAQRFVADDPPPQLIEKMGAKFTQTHGDIREVMKVMLESKEFLSDGAYHSKVKTPLEMIASAVRATGAQVDFAMPLANQIGQLGEPLYRKIEPTGYSSANAEWVSSASLLGRMNFALQLAQNRVPGVKVDDSKFADDPSAAARMIMATDVTPQTREAILKALEDQKAKNPKAPMPALVAGLVMGSPDFQRR